jgi:hypothetical protein
MKKCNKETIPPKMPGRGRPSFPILLRQLSALDNKSDYKCILFLLHLFDMLAVLQSFHGAAARQNTCR